MPYGLPAKFNTEANNQKMERCVVSVMKQGHDKSSAIAICKNALLHSKSKSKKAISIDDLIKGEGVSEENMAKKSIKKADKKVIKAKEDADIKKDDEVVADEEVQEETTAPEDVTPATEEAAQEETTEEVTEEETTEEAPAEEAEEETAEEEASDEATEDEAEEDSESEEEDEEVSKTLDPIAVLKSISEMEDPKEIREAIQAALSQLTKTDDSGKVTQAPNIGVDVVTLLGKMEKRLIAIEEFAKVSADEADADTEEGEATEDTSEEASAETTVDTPAEDTSADTSPEGDESNEEESIEKVDSKINDAIAKAEAKFSQKIDGITEALEKVSKAVETLKSQPVPARVRSPFIVEKGDAVSSEESSARVKEIDAELGKLQDIKINNLEKYQAEGLENKAMNLINEKNRLVAGL